MTIASIHKRLRWRHFFYGLVCTFGISWFVSEIQFRVFKAEEAQRRLFGKEIASWRTLERASNDCCAMDASGILEWTYALPAGQAEALAKRCRRRNGAPLHFKDESSPYFDEHTNQCIVARIYDKKKAEDLTAEVAGRMLTVRLFYIDPDLIGSNFSVVAANASSAQ